MPHKPRGMAGMVVAAFCCLTVTVTVLSEETPVRTNTQYGTLVGTRRVVDLNMPEIMSETVDEYLGIPYAAPPTGNRRLEPPVNPPSWSGERDATKHGNVCPQESNFQHTEEQYQSEDCLYLNIYTPWKADRPKMVYPVMVFIHGGSYLYGSGNRYNGTALAQYGVILVAINYRLGALGFLTTGNDNLMGNYGLMDQVQALHWLRDNIAHFRGDHTKITIFGSSAGGASVGLLLFSPPAKGLFHGIIAQSGTANAMWATHSDTHLLQSNVQKLAQGFSCYGGTTDQHFVQCLKQVDWKKFKWKNVCGILHCTEVDPLFKPVIDGRLLHKSPAEYLRGSSYPPMAYMTGTVRAEFGDYYSANYTREDLYAEVDSFLSHRYPHSPAVLNIIKYEYTDWTRARSPEYNCSRRYMNDRYQRAQVLSDLGLVAPTDAMAHQLSQRPGMRVYLYHVNNDISYHSVELNYVFGVPFAGGDVDEMGIIKQFNESDKDIAVMFMKLWTDFAKHGNPTPDTGTLGHKWAHVTPNNMDYLYIKGLHTEMGHHLRGRKVALWNSLVSTLQEEELAKKKPEFFASQTWVFFGLAMILFAVVVLLACIILHGNRKSKKYSQLLRGNSTTSNSYSVNL